MDLKPPLATRYNSHHIGTLPNSPVLHMRVSNARISLAISLPFLYFVSNALFLGILSSVCCSIQTSIHKIVYNLPHHLLGSTTEAPCITKHYMKLVQRLTE